MKLLLMEIIILIFLIDFVNKNLKKVKRKLNRNMENKEYLNHSNIYLHEKNRSELTQQEYFDSKNKVLFISHLEDV